MLAWCCKCVYISTMTLATCSAVPPFTNAPLKTCNQYPLRRRLVKSLSLARNTVSFHQMTASWELSNKAEKSLQCFGFRLIWKCWACTGNAMSVRGGVKGSTKTDFLGMVLLYPLCVECGAASMDGTSPALRGRFSDRAVCAVPAAFTNFHWLFVLTATSQPFYSKYKISQQRSGNELNDKLFQFVRWSRRNRFKGGTHTENRLASKSSGTQVPGIQPTHYFLEFIGVDSLWKDHTHPIPLTHRTHSILVQRTCTGTSNDEGLTILQEHNQHLIRWLRILASSAFGN